MIHIAKEHNKITECLAKYKQEQKLPKLLEESTNEDVNLATNIELSESTSKSSKSSRKPTTSMIPLIISALENLPDQKGTSAQIFDSLKDSHFQNGERKTWIHRIHSNLYHNKAF